jgi:hypothetical protein
MDSITNVTRSVLENTCNECSLEFAEPNIETEIMVRMAPDEKDAPKNDGEACGALKQSGTAMLGKHAQFEECMIFRSDCGRRRCLHRHQCSPHAFVDLMAFFRQPTATSLD